MILIVAAAIVGAAAGLYVQPRMLALAVALSVSGAAQIVIGFVGRLAQKGPNHEAASRWMVFLGDFDVHGLWPVMAAAGAGCLLAAVFWSLFRNESTDRFWLPRPGEEPRGGVRSMALVEERDIHRQAKARLDRAMDR
ncbi:MAG: hypothetical protein ACOY4K_08820 [Pseudomonadota bacterium]